MHSTSLRGGRTEVSVGLGGCNKKHDRGRTRAKSASRTSKEATVREHEQLCNDVQEAVEDGVEAGQPQQKAGHTQLHEIQRQVAGATVTAVSE